MIILGIDPGYGITGYGLIEVDHGTHPPKLIEAGVLTSKKEKNLSQRLHEIYINLQSLLKEFSPQALALEEVFSVPSFPKSAFFIGNVHGIVHLAAVQSSVPIFSYYPIQVKKILLGYGRAQKAQTQRMVQRVFNLDKIPQPDDVADALALALCHAHRTRNLN